MDNEIFCLRNKKGKLYLVFPYATQSNIIFNKYTKSGICMSPDYMKPVYLLV